MSKKNAVKMLIERLRDEFFRTSNDLFTYTQLYSIAQSMGLPLQNFRDFLDSANHQGYLLKKPNNVFKLCI